MSKMWFEELVRWEKLKEKQRRKREKKDDRVRAEFRERLLDAIKTVIPLALSTLMPNSSQASAFSSGFSSVTAPPPPPVEMPAALLSNEELLDLMKSIHPDQHQRFLDILDCAVRTGGVRISAPAPQQPQAQAQARPS